MSLPIDDPHDTIMFALENATMQIRSRNYRGAHMYLKMLSALVFYTCVMEERRNVGIPIITFPPDIDDKERARIIGEALREEEERTKWFWPFFKH